MAAKLVRCYIEYHRHRPRIFFFHNYTTTLSSSTSADPTIINYLTHSLGFSPPRALDICNLYPHLKPLEKLKSVVDFLKSIGFSDTHIRSSVNLAPQILCSRIDHTLKPKIQLFKDMGVPDSDLGKFFSLNSKLLTRSLHKRLIPCIAILREVVGNDKDLIRVISNCNCNRIFNKDPESLKVVVCYLMECGIVGSRLSMLLKQQPRILTMSVCDIEVSVRKVLDLGLSVDSRVFVHALDTFNSISSDIISKKFKLFRSFGFSLDDCNEMFRKMPVLFKASEEKLKFGLSFYLQTVKLEKFSIVRCPTCLMYSMENRVMPRYRVLQILESKRLLKKSPSFIIVVVRLKEGLFVDKFISRFACIAEELLVAYKEHLLQSSEETAV